MDRFDGNFNDVDPITGRPFSGGHPDGVWMIIIFYSLLVIAAVAHASFAVFGADDEASVISPAVVGGFITIGICSAVIFQSLKRKKNALLLSAIYLGLIAINAVLGAFIGMAVTPVQIVMLVVQSYITYYLYGLYKDELLK